MTLRTTGSSWVPCRILLGILIAATSLGTLSAKGKYKKWLNEEVVWIISRAEEEAFKALKSDADREEFIQEFWRRRDPTPSTQRNEYKEEHYRRLAHAREAYREGVPGWKTDRGRIYIIHGPPDSEGFRRSRSRISPDREIPSTARNPNTIIWAYHQLPNAKYYRGEMRLIFQPNSGINRQNFVLSESKTAQDRAEQFSKRFFPASDSNWMEADVRYRLVMAGPPAVINASGAELPNSGFGEFSRYVEDLFRSPGELLEEKEREQRRRSDAQKELAEVKANVGFESFEVQMSHDAFWRGPGQWWMPLQVSWTREQAAAEAFDVYVALLDSSGTVFDEFIDTVEPPEQPSEEGVRYRNAFSLPSGQYTVRAVVRGSKSRRTAVKEMPLVLTETGIQKLRFDGLLLTNRVEVLPEGDVPDAGNGVVFNQTRLLPSYDQRFSQDNYLLLYFQLRLPVNSQIAAVNIKFIRDGEVVMKMDDKSVEKSAAGVAEYGSAFALKEFEPGLYTVQVQAIDAASRSYQIRRTRFEVQPAAN